MIAKFALLSVVAFSQGVGENLSFAPVCASTFGPNGESDDNDFARWTPSGKLEMAVTNPNLVGKFKEGDKFYLTFTPEESGRPIFHLANQPLEGMDFGSAIVALKAGKRVARAGWNVKGLFVFMQVPAIIGCDVIPRMQSLPESVKAEFARRVTPEIRYSNQLALVSPENEITGWSPSTSDALAEDWFVVPDPEAAEESAQS